MTAPDWSPCRAEACTGIQARGFDRCLAHLDAEELDRFLRPLRPGANLDVRGTTISDELLVKLEDAVRDGRRARFGNVNFNFARFTTVRAGFVRAEFGYATFVGAEFAELEQLGPWLAIELTLDRAKFAKWFRTEGLCDRITCVGTNFSDGVSLRVQSKVIDATAAVFGSRSTIANGDRRPVGIANVPELISLRETDVSNLVLVDVSLTWCLFTGAHRLDQLRIEGRIRFNSPPGPWRTRRQMLAEEHIARGFAPPNPYVDDGVRIGPERIAVLYRSLRKAFEDSKNEAGAGDFYYGEMEMRRRSPTTRRAERLILWAYWLLSGYGQRAGRAVVALGVLVAIVCILLFTVGLPGGVGWSWARIDQSLRIGMGAVVFREAGQTLTSAGSWTVMVARFAGPVLLALALLAVRARVKR